MKVSYTLNGQPLDSARMRVIVGTTHHMALSPIVESVQVSGRSGAVIGSSTPVLDVPELTVKVAAWGADSDLLISRFRALCLLSTNLVVGRTETSDGGLTRSMSARAVCTSCEPDDDERPFQDLRVMTAVFQLPDVYWQGEQWVDKTLPAVGGTLVSGANPSAGLAWDSDAPLLNLVMRFTDVSSVRVSCAASGTDLEWSAAASVRNLYLDVPNRRAWTSDRTDAWDGGMDATAGVDWTSEPLQAWPSIDSGDYLLAVEQSGTGQVACRYKQSWE